MNKKLNVFLMYAIVFLQGFVFYGPIATIYREARGLSIYNIFIIEAISWILMIIFEIPWGWFADRFGYKKTILISNIIFFISKIVFYKAYSFQMFLLERVLISLALSGLSGCDIALLYLSTEGEKSERTFGRYSAFSTGGFLIASLLTTLIISSPINKTSIDRTGLLTIIPYGLAVIVSIFIKDVETDNLKKPKLRESIKIALGNRDILLLVISVALAREVVQAISVFLNQIQYTRSGINIKYFGILLVVIQIARLGSAKAYKLSDKFGKYNSIQGLYILITLGTGILIFTSNPILSIFSVILISVSISLVEPIALEIENKSIDIGARATILSIYAMLADVTAALVNPVIGKAAQLSLVAAFETCGGICIVMYILFRIYRNKQKLTN